MFKYGLTLELPGDKKPGYYARIVKTIGQANTLFDRDGELLIFSTPEDLETAAENIARYKAAGEKIPAPPASPGCGSVPSLDRLRIPIPHGEPVFV